MYGCRSESVNGGSLHPDESGCDLQAVFGVTQPSEPARAKCRQFVISRPLHVGCRTGEPTTIFHPGKELWPFERLWQSILPGIQWQLNGTFRDIRGNDPSQRMSQIWRIFSRDATEKSAVSHTYTCNLLMCTSSMREYQVCWRQTSMPWPSLCQIGMQKLVQRMAPLYVPTVP